MPNSPDNNWGKFASIGLEIAIGVGLGFFIGAWIDKRAHSTPWAAVIGAMLGMMGGLYLLIKETNRMNRN